MQKNVQGSYIFVGISFCCGVFLILGLAGVHLGFEEGKGPNFRKEANQHKTKKKPNISHTSPITF